MRKEKRVLYKGAFYRLATAAEKEVERLLLTIIPVSPFANKVFAVGGYVRDEVMGLQSKDLDLVIEMPDGSEKLSKYIFGLFPGKVSTPRQVGQGYPIWHITFKDDVEYKGEAFATKDADLDLADTQKEAFPDPDSRQRITLYGTLGDDTERRDFTVNMLLKDMTTGEIVDPAGTGVDDIKNGILRLHPNVDPNKPFADDPLRMLRLIRFSVKYGWKPDPTAIEAVKRNAKRIDIVSGERILGELTKIMQMGKFDQAIKLMREVGLLKYVMPEIEALVGVEQPKKFHAEGDVFNHTMEVLKNAKPTLEAQLAALLHDVGKPATQVFLEEKIQFPKHEDVSAEMARAIMTRLKVGKDTIEKVVHLVKNHMRAHTSQQWSEKALRKFIREMGDYLEDVLDLTAADALGRKMDDDVPRKGDDYIVELRDRIKKQKEQVPVSSKPVLNGKEVMDILQIKPGKGVGDAMAWLQDKSDDLVEEGKILTPELAKELLATEYKKRTGNTVQYRGARYVRVAFEGEQLELPGVKKSLLSRIEALRDKLAEAANKVVTEWEQDEEGVDCELGGGGACDDVARAMGDVLAENGIDTADGGADGDDHAWLIAYDEDTDEVVDVDVPPHVYESGGGYSWKKHKDAHVDPDDVVIQVDPYVTVKELLEGADY